MYVESYNGFTYQDDTLHQWFCPRRVGSKVSYFETVIVIRTWEEGTGMMEHHREKIINFHQMKKNSIKVHPSKVAEPKNSSQTFFRAFCNLTMSTSDHEEDFADLFGVSQCSNWMSEKVSNSVLIESVRDQTTKKSSNQSILFKSFNGNQSLSLEVWYLYIWN